jgi:hypothetical protein
MHNGGSLIEHTGGSTQTRSTENINEKTVHSSERNINWMHVYQTLIEKRKGEEFEGLQDWITDDEI